MSLFCYKLDDEAFDKLPAYPKIICCVECCEYCIVDKDGIYNSVKLCEECTNIDCKCCGKKVELSYRCLTETICEECTRDMIECSKCQKLVPAIIKYNELNYCSICYEKKQNKVSTLHKIENILTNHSAEFKENTYITILNELKGIY